MPKNICFVSPYSYPVLAKKNMGYTGGAEVQQVILAKELLKHGFEVSFVTFGDGQVPIEYLDDIKVIKVYKREAASNLTLFSKAWCIWKAMRQANADIYFHETGSFGVVSLFCCLARKKFIRYVASDGDVDKSRHLSFVQRFGNWLDFKLANMVIVQNEYQGKMLKVNYGRESLIIKNAFPIPERRMTQKTNPSIILWVATIRDVKQPELFLKLAQAIPWGSFQMVGGAWDNPELYGRVTEMSATVPNLDFVGFVPFSEVNRYFEQALILVNTSKYEGFSNTFIQAWLQYVPVVSLNSDPDEVICINRLGFHSKTFQQLTEDVRTLLKDEQLREEMGRNGRQYVEKEHDITKVVPRYLEVFNRLLENTKARL